MENKSNVFITVYEESSRRPSSGRPEAERRKIRAPPGGYDRRVMLLAYSQQLRQVSDQKVQLQQWKRWKSTYKEQNYKKRGFRWKARAWIQRVFRRRRRGYHQIEIEHRQRTIKMSSCCSCFKNWRLRHVISRISSAWKRRGGLMGCCEKLKA